MSKPLFRRIPSGPVTWTIGIVCILVYVVLQVDLQGGLWRELHFFANEAQLRSGDEWWRWLTPSLVHMNLFHIGFNLVWWWQLGGIIEILQGRMRLAGLFVALNVASNLAQFWLAGPAFGGLSGVVYGLLGYLWVYGKVAPASPLRLNPVVMRAMMIWLVVCMTGLLGPVANGAHVGGLVAGALLGLPWGLVDRARWRRLSR